MIDIDVTVVRNFLIALLIGALVGVEPCWHAALPCGRAPGGYSGPWTSTRIC